MIAKATMSAQALPENTNAAVPPVPTSGPRKVDFAGSLAYSCQLLSATSASLNQSRINDAAKGTNQCPAVLIYGKELLNITLTFTSPDPRTVWLLSALLSFRRQSNVLPPGAHNTTLWTAPYILGNSSNFTITFDPTSRNVSTDLAIEMNFGFPGLPLQSTFAISEQNSQNTVNTGMSSTIVYSSYIGPLITVVNETIWLAGPQNATGTVTATTGIPTVTGVPRTVVIPAAPPPGSHATGLFSFSSCLYLSIAVAIASLAAL
eukprot:jgi/Hompol1/2675/HPOL_006111-RA